MPFLEVVPHPAPAEHFAAAVEISVDEPLAVQAATIEDWVGSRQAWELSLREGTQLDRPNNVEAVLRFMIGDQTSTVTFRLDQLDSVHDLGDELVIFFEEREGIAKAARLTANGLDVELFHILTFT